MSDVHSISSKLIIKTTNYYRPHVVILGAGASRAALPVGDRNGIKVPLMDDFIKILGLESLFNKIGINYEEKNFEEIYSELSENPKYSDIYSDLNNRIYDFFSSLELPDEVTIYDLLILSLREKDVIATFNWDPFLIQAIRRNYEIAKPPKVYFLHGNVLAAFCLKDSISGLKGNLCSKCNKPFRDSNLLYPITKKNYSNDKFIKGQWDGLRFFLENCFMLTIFGYSAPKSDEDAKSLMKKAWNPAHKAFESVEIIDTKSQLELEENWKEFIEPFYHDSCLTSYDNSFLYNFPRRTGEAHEFQNIEANFIESLKIPKTKDLAKIQNWFTQLTKMELN